ncbi:hypothetical protein GW7_15527 [Heterocephalus glaber]|uniref:Uncharacterized protein n=1 Tax=Heterocephalus glaber TaxID=10181 RepID=G5BRU5_HETGA|nr:hypothetical protein GW7_15527 [Heterocephalus glaber]
MKLLPAPGGTWPGTLGSIRRGTQVPDLQGLLGQRRALDFQPGHYQYKFQRQLRDSVSFSRAPPLAPENYTPAAHPRGARALDTKIKRGHYLAKQALVDKRGGGGAALLWVSRAQGG